MSIENTYPLLEFNNLKTIQILHSTGTLEKEKRVRHYEKNSKQLLGFWGTSYGVS